jgi:hypothetical protein
MPADGYQLLEKAKIHTMQNRKQDYQLSLISSILQGLA